MVLLYCLKKDGQAFADEFETVADAVEFGDRYWSCATEATRRGIVKYAVVDVEGEAPCITGAPVKVWKDEAEDADL